MAQPQEGSDLFIYFFSSETKLKLSEIWAMDMNAHHAYF